MSQQTSVHPIPRRPDEDWKKDLFRDGTRVFRQMEPVPYPDNDREMIIDHLFQVGGAVNEIEHWRLVPGPGCSEQCWKVGYAPLTVWTSAGAGNTLILRGEVEADLTGFASLKVRALAARQAQVSVYAEIDTDAPEASANPVIPYHAGQYGRPNVIESPFASPFPRARALAYVGLVEKRPDLLRVSPSARRTGKNPHPTDKAP